MSSFECNENPFSEGVEDDILDSFTFVESCEQSPVDRFGILMSLDDERKYETPTRFNESWRRKIVEWFFQVCCAQVNEKYMTHSPV